MKNLLGILLATSVCFTAVASFADDLPAYIPQKLGETTLNSVGSDSMAPIMDAWVSEFRKYHPKLLPHVLSHGSASAPAALIEGTADVGPMARRMKRVERKDFRAKYGFEPTQIRTAIAGTGIYVSKENPVKSISIDDLDRIFSKDLKRAEKGTVVNWGSLGVKKRSIASGKILPLGSGVAAPHVSYFKQRVMKLGEFKPEVVVTVDSGSMFETIARNPSAIGFGNIEFDHPESVKILAVKKDKSEQAVVPSNQTISNGSYPLSRFLNVYVVREPGEGIEKETKEFLRFILSKEGQALVAQKGLIPLPAEIVAEELAKLN